MTDVLRRERRTTIVTSALVAAAIVAGVLVVLIGRWQQDGERIGRVAAVSILSTSGRHVGAPSRFGPAVANELAATVDGLGRMPSGDMTCGEETGHGYLLRFQDVHSPGPVVYVDRGGCSGVTATLHGNSYGPTRWDPYARLRHGIARALAAR